LDVWEGEEMVIVFIVFCASPPAPSPEGEGKKDFYEVDG
jgi:hypothetical protein